MKRENKQYKVVMPKAYHERIKELSEITGQSMNALIIFGIEALLNKGGNNEKDSLHSY